MFLAWSSREPGSLGGHWREQPQGRVSFLTAHSSPAPHLCLDIHTRSHAQPDVLMQPLS
jgi:hypothetical protein